MEKHIDEAAKALAEEINKDMKEKGAPWYAGIFNQKIVDVAMDAAQQKDVVEPEDEREHKEEEKSFSSLDLATLEGMKQMQEERKLIMDLDRETIRAMKSINAVIERIEIEQCVLRKPGDRIPHNIEMEYMDKMAALGKVIAELRNSARPVGYPTMGFGCTV